MLVYRITVEYCFLQVHQEISNTGDFPLHECEVKEGTSILIPIVNVICNDSVIGSPLFGANEQDHKNMCK